ncbi:Trigger factor [uncultured delta proteobacterium]|uniref:Trigger factor n=1 Tax=uncultured delta proteobacterium TaxID=34034 RepID=A0A212J2D4_9DELT|nr:Trigger factor [uncultured delta proteobacterium]
MQHTVEDLSPVKKKVAVTVPAEEVDAVLNRTIAQYRSRVALPGFRKGKAPMAMIEKRFSQDIYSDAVNELVNGNIGEILREMDVDPLGDLSFDGDNAPLKRGEAFSYAFSFETMPAMTLPEYDGIGVAEETPVVEEKEIDDVLERVRRGMAERAPVEEKRLPGDGDVVTMDFAGFDENGEPVEGVSGENFQVAIGDSQVIPDFEALARTIMPGDSGEGKVTFPEDYGHKPLAGKTVTMKITAKSLQARKLPELDDEFAKKAGGLDSLAAMRDNIKETYMKNRKEMVKAKAQSLLLEKLLENMDFPLPEGMVERYTQNIMHGRVQELSREGKDLATLVEDDFTKMKEEAQKEAANFAKTQLFLLTVAKKEGLEATPQEMNAALRQIASRNGHDIKEVQEHYSRNNLYPALRDRILADKAMDRIYDKASGEDMAGADTDGAKPAKAKKAEKTTDEGSAQSENDSE